MWLRIFFCIRSSEWSTSARIPLRRKVSDHVLQVVAERLGDRDADDLDRREPGRERAGVVLGEDAEEPLDRAEQRAVDHVRLLPVPSDAVYSRSNRSGSWKSTWMVLICQVRPMASLACTEIFGA